jgi:alpha-1,6-mannosyltransferase
VLVAVAVLSPATLPWYLTWGFVLVAAIAWQRRHLAVVVGVAVFLVLTYSPAGEDQLYKPLYLLGAFAISVLAGISLLHPDPLRLSTSPRPTGSSPLDVLKGAFRTVNVSKESFKAWLRDTR